MTGYGSWGLLEPDNRDAAPTRGAQGLLADPAWMLSRQWSFGELDGFDGGAPATTVVRHAVVPIDRIDVEGQTSSPPGGAQGPAPLAEPQAAAPDPGRSDTDPNLAARLREAMAALAEEEDAPTVVRMAARRGRLTSATIARVEAAQTPAVRDALAHIADLLHAASATPAPLPDPFSTETLDHRATWVSHPENTGSDAMGEAQLVSAEDRPSWWSLEDMRAPEPATWEEARPIPARMSFPGAPPTRHWAVTEATTDWLAVEAGPSELPTMIAALALSQVAPDTLVLPLTVPRSGVLRLKEVEVVDAFGHATRHKSATTGPDLWGARADGDRPGTLCDFAARIPLEGEPIETVAVVPEDATGTVWLVERRVPGVKGDGHLIVESVEPDEPPDEGDPAAYDLRRAPPANWMPLLPHDDDPVLVPRPLISGMVPTSLQGLIGPAVTHIRRDAVPREGVGIERRWKLGRDVEGRAVAWIARRVGPHDERAASGLAFDRLILPGDRA